MAEKVCFQMDRNMNIYLIPVSKLKLFTELLSSDDKKAFNDAFGKYKDKKDWFSPSCLM